MHRPQIDALAQALLAREKIGQREINEMLRPRTMPVRDVVDEVVAALEPCGAL